MVGTGKAAENGIIIKNAASLQIAAEIDKIIFDKTGTLTEGKPKLTDIVSYIGNEDEVLMLAASLEKPSGHVLSDALVEAAKEKGIFLKPMQQFETISGKGVVGKIEEGQTILAGNRRLMQERAIDLKIAAGDLDRLEEQGKTIILVAKEDKLMGLVAVRDTVKKLSRTLIAKLKGMGKDVIMITGDNKRTALAIAKEIGIQKVLAEVLPKDKLGEIKKLQNDGFKVAFVGDGINDAPALSGADLGIAIGSGTDIAIESGDIILIKDDLADVATAIELSGYAMRKIKQNLFWAFFYNMIGIPIAAGILYPFNGLLLNPMVAGAAMAFSSVSVVLNSLLMNSYKPSV